MKITKLAVFLMAANLSQVAFSATDSASSDTGTKTVATQAKSAQTPKMSAQEKAKLNALVQQLKQRKRQTLGEMLNFTPAQSEKMKSLQQKNRQAMMPLVQKMQTLRFELSKLASSDTYSAKQAQSSAKAQGEVFSKVVLLQADLQHNVYQLMTKAQREKLKSLQGGK